MDKILELAVAMTDERIKKEDKEFQKLVKNYEKCLSDFESYLKTLKNDNSKFNRIGTYLKGISFKMNLLIDKLEEKDGE